MSVPSHRWRGGVPSKKGEIYWGKKDVFHQLYPEIGRYLCRERERLAAQKPFRDHRG